MVSALLENRYRVIELLGRGGMGEVVRVFDTVEGREVALKRLIIEGVARDDAAVELFEREFHTLSELSHPRIIEVYDYGVSATGAYYTMELLTGSDLRGMRQVHWTLACALLRDIASSLAIIHSRRLLHADLSPRNVRCTADGRAKLLDFGAMMPMGPPRHLTGTPPFVAPETVHGFPLDGRTDIYGLGALAYFLLVGRNAYPARELADLIERWAVPPRAPHELEPSIPEPLSNLIMECLQLDRSARPRTAGIVMERLCTIAALPLEEHQEVAAAYLTTPTLVGRMEQLARVRQIYASTAGTRGGVIIAEGTCGSGRSRFLSACVLEGKLAGRKVVHVAAGEAGAQRYGVARAICRQLFTLAPQSAHRAARAHGSLLAHVLDPGLVGASPSSGATPADRILRALSDFVAGVSQDVDLVIAIDDADRSDDESMALLLSTAQRSNERAPCIVLTVDSAGEGSFALDALRRHADPLSLPPLTEQQAEELIQSVFGAAKHSVSLARRLHAVAGGHPRAMLQLARHLVDEGIVRYEAGSFVLPERLDERDLPASLGAALARRFDALDGDAAELACILSLTDPRDVAPGRYVELTNHGDRRRAFRALDHLVRAEFLVPEGDRYRLGDATWRSVVKERLSEIELRPLHARLARHFEADGGVNRRAFHLMRSGDAKAAALVLLAQYLKDPNEPRDPLEDYVPGLLDLLEEISNAAEHLDIPTPLKIELRMKTLGASQFVGDLERFLRLAPPLLERLKRDSGLSDYEELASVDPSERLSAAFARVQARFESIPEQKRGLPLFEAMREVARLCVMYSGISAIALDVFIIRSVPDLSPLVALSPAIGAIKQMLDSTRLLLEGRSIESRNSLLKLLERLDEPDRAGLGELYHRSLRLGGVYIMGLVEASLGMASAEERATELQDEPGHRVNAQRIHMTSRLVRGDMEGAAAAQRHAELLMLQEAQYQRYPGTTARSELHVSAMLEDVAAIRELTERMGKATLSYPRWGIYVHLGRHYHRRLQRDFAGALAALEPAFAVTAPLDHRDWALVAAAHVQALCDVGKADEAVRVGRQYLDTCRNLALYPGASQVGQAVASALLSTGAAGEAATLVDELIEEATAWRVGGIAFEMLYELRAQAALAQRDEAALERCIALCRGDHESQLVPAVAARIQRLVRDARRAGMLRSPIHERVDLEPDYATLITLETTARTELSEALDPSMLEHTEIEDDCTTTAVLR
jgi:serine/threonine-protein kinase